MGRLIIALCLGLAIGCAPQVRYAVGNPQSYREQGFHGATALMGFYATDVSTLRGGAVTPYRALDSDGSGGWMDAISLNLTGPGATNRFYSLTRTFGKPPEAFRKYTFDLSPGTNGLVTDDGPVP